jgi:hypothetical protein
MSLLLCFHFLSTKAMLCHYTVKVGATVFDLGHAKEQKIYSNRPDCIVADAAADLALFGAHSFVGITTKQ